jgi:hypothetical protein
MYDRINNGEFNTSMKYPARPHRPILHREHSATEAESYAVKLAEYETEFSAYNVALDEYNATVQELTRAFEKAALEAVGLTGHKGAAAAFGFAWEHGHSGGFAEVYGWLVEVADLIDQVS